MILTWWKDNNYVQNVCVSLEHLCVLTGAGIYAFVILKDDVVASVETIAEDLKALVKKKIAAFAMPNQFLVSIYTLPVKKN